MNPQNIGYVIRFNGFTLFHTGDAISNDLSVYQNYKLSEDSIDVAFFPRWFFDTEFGTKGADIMKYINPKAIIAMHVPTLKYTYYKNAANAIQGIAPLHFIDTQMDTLRIEKRDSTTSPVQLEPLVKPDLQFFSSTTNGHFILQLGSEIIQEAQVQLFSVSGCIMQTNTFSQVKKIDLDLTGQPEGFYLIRIHADGKIYIKKVCYNVN